MLNKTDIAAPLGVGVPTVSQWLPILEVTGKIILVQPFFENFGKRLVKTPKLYFVDSGLACHLVGIRDRESLDRSPFRGALFEGSVAAEIIKARVNRGLDRSLYYFRDRQGLEVDFVVDLGNRRLSLIEAEAGETPRPGDATGLKRLAKAVGRYKAGSALIHQGDPAVGSTLLPGVEAVPFNSSWVEQWVL